MPRPRTPAAETAPTIDRARALRSEITAAAAARGLSNLRVLRYPGLAPDADLELVADFDHRGRTGLELFEFSDAVGALVGCDVITGTGVRPDGPPAGWWVEAL